MSLNLAGHVDDEPRDVSENRERLVAAHDLPHAPIWLAQVHGTLTVDAAQLDPAHSVQADAVYTREPDRVCAILTADCLPIVLAAANGSEVAVLHAGWRGLLDNIVAAGVAAFAARPAEIMAWIGPGIGVNAYRVDAAFRARFIARKPAFAAAFVVLDGALYADLGAIAGHLLHCAGVMNVSRYHGCTFREAELFYSNRRDRTTGRMATVAWIDSRARQ
jgi:YfiH family protein